MAKITIRKLDDPLLQRLRVRTAPHASSGEDEAQGILRDAVADQEPKTQNLALAIRRRFEPLGGLDLKVPPRQPIRERPNPTPDGLRYPV